MDEIEQLFIKFDGAFAKNTIRAYWSDFADFKDWCLGSGIDPLQSQPEDWVDYIEASMLIKSTATVTRRINSLATIFKLGGWQGYSQHPDVILAMKRMYRQKGRAQLQATPLTRDILSQLLAICSDDNQGMRDRVLLQLGYETMRRRSELCHFRFENIRQLPNGLKAILLTRSKTDQYGQGKLIALSDHLSELLSAWHHIAGDGYILRGLPPHRPMTTHLAPASINCILRRLQRAAGLTLPQDLSGHSFRVGRALDLLMEGEPLEKIMLRGGWKSESTAMRYLRAWSELG